MSLFMLSDTVKYLMYCKSDVYWVSLQNVYAAWKIVQEKLRNQLVIFQLHLLTEDLS